MSKTTKWVIVLTVGSGLGGVDSWGGEVPPEDIPEPPAISYQGKYASDPRLQPLKESFPALWQKAWVQIRERLGLRYQDYGAGRVSVSLRDLPPNARGADFASTGGGRGNQNIMLRIEYLLNGLAPFPVEFTHELTHAVLRHCLGRAHDRLPSWMREGLAAWSANQREELFAWFVGRALHTEDPLTQRGRPIINGLEGGRHQGSDLIEDILTIEFLHSRLGQEKFFEWSKSLAGGTSVYQAIQEHAGLTQTEFSEQAKTYAEAQIHSAIRDIHEPYREAVRLHNEKQCEAAIAKFQALREAHPGHWIKFWCQLYEGMGWHHQKAWEKVVTSVDAILPSGGAILFLHVSGALFRKMEALAEMGKPDQAIAEAEQFLLDHPYADNLAEVRRFRDRLKAVVPQTPMPVPIQPPSPEPKPD